MKCQHCGSENSKSCEWINTERVRLRHEGYLEAEIDAWEFRQKKETPPCWKEYPDIQLDWRWFVGGLIFGIFLSLFL